MDETSEYFKTSSRDSVDSVLVIKTKHGLWIHSIRTELNQNHQNCEPVLMVLVHTEKYSIRSLKRFRNVCVSVLVWTLSA